MVAESGPGPLDRNALCEIVEGTAAETGEAFFDELVKHLARAIGTKCAWVTEYLEPEQRLRALSFWVGDDFFGDFEYDIAQTPCEPVIENRRLIHVPERVLELYAHDASLEPLGAVSYMGVPLFDTDDRILGHLAVLHDAPMPEDERITAIFNIFAGRAAAELRRLRRDRDNCEREQKLSRLIDSAMDAIVELDGELRVASMNSAAERVFGCDLSELRETPFDAFLTRESRGKLAYLTAGELRELERVNLLRALAAAGWKVSEAGGAAERLGMKPNTLASRMKALRIRRPGPPEKSLNSAESAPEISGITRSRNDCGSTSCNVNH